MTLPSIEPLPDENTSLPPARRRRQRRMILPQDSSEQAEFLRELAREIVPSFDFFLFSLFAGAALGVAILLDAPALFVLAALIAPFMAPAVGIALGTVAGKGRFILQSLGSLATGSLIVFLCGALTGWAANLLPARAYQQVAFHSRFAWPDFVLLIIGAALTTYMIARAPRQKPLVSSVAMAYGLYLPVGAAGFGLTSGIGGLWPDGLALFFNHLVWAVIAGIIVLAFLGLRPLTRAGIIAVVVYVLVGLAALSGALAALSQVNILPPAVTEQGAAASQPSATSAPTLPASPGPTRLPSSTPVPAQNPTPTRSLVPTLTATITITPQPTPVWARINAMQGDGALVREKPDYNATVVSSVLNGTLVEILPEVDSSGGATWVHIRLVNGKDGWVVRSLLRTATPAPGW